MTGWIIKEPCELNTPDLTEDRPVFMDIETGKHFIYCNGCMESGCLTEVDISYAVKQTLDLGKCTGCTYGDIMTKKYAFGGHCIECGPENNYKLFKTKDTLLAK